MKRKRLLWCVWLLLLWTGLVLSAPSAAAQQPDGQQALPGAQQWQPYLDESPAAWEEFVDSPLETLRSFLPGDLAGAVREMMRSYADLLLFLLLAALVGFLTEGQADAALLELVTAGGCGMLLWNDLLELAGTLSEHMQQWRSFLLGFLPVYAGVLTAGGEPSAGAAASGLLLTALCFLAQLISAWARPLLECALALSMACCISADRGLAAACRAAYKLLRQGIGWAGKLFALLLSLQRVFTLQMDRTSLKLSQLLTGTVPVVGQALSDAAETLLSGIQLLKSGLGFAALATLSAEFVPFYGALMLHLILLAGCEMLCEFTGIRRCAALLGCLRESVRCMAAATALFYGMTVFGTVLMLAVGGG
ncbi:MAG: stage III sporulation protein AE [Faecalibacterium sp.]